MHSSRMRAAPLSTVNGGVSVQGTGMGPVGSLSREGGGL